MSQTIHRFLSLTALTLTALLAGLGPARAGLEPEKDRPYFLRVVLDVARNRQLTRIFQDRLQRDLRDMLQADLGDLARVEVVRKHKLLPEIRSRGLKKALDGYTRVEEGKTHFVLVDFSGGHFEIQARQHDGLTGMPSPLVRRDQTTDPRLVARKAVQLIREDFGLVGTVTKTGNQAIALTLKGGGLGVPLDRRVQPNDLFAIAQVSKGGQGQRSVPMPWAFLQVTSGPTNGVCLCQFYHRFQDDALTEQPEGEGYRCLKLTTTRAPLRLRFLDSKTHAPLTTALQIKVGTAGFESLAETLSTDLDTGVAQAHQPYRTLAFVRVLNSGKQVAQLPVPILSDRTVDCLISVNPEAEAQGQKELRRERWLRRIYESLRVASERVSELNKLGKESMARAQAIAREGLMNMEADLKSLGEEQARLTGEEGAALAEDNPLRELRKEGEQRLKELRERKGELERYAKRLDAIIKEERDPKRQEMFQLLEQARLQETQAEFGKAIRIYEQVLKDHPKETNVRDRLVLVKKAFHDDDRDPVYLKARRFVYETYPKLQTPAQLKEGVREAAQAFKVFRAKHDLLSPQKILRANIAHTASLKKRLESLHPETSEDDRREVKTIAEVAGEMKALHLKIQTYLKENKPPVP